MVLGLKIDGFRLRKPGGLSIYLPELNAPFRRNRSISPEYANLDFASTGWPDVIRQPLQSRQTWQTSLRLRGSRGRQGRTPRARSASTSASARASGLGGKRGSGTAMTCIPAALPDWMPAP